MQRLQQLTIRKMTPRLIASTNNSTNYVRSGSRLFGNIKAVGRRTFSEARVFSSSTPDRSLQAWEVPKWDCHGDYRQEAFLEDPSKPLYEHQLKLPRLPVPQVADTLERFLPTALPLAESKEEAESLKACVASFAKESEQLQERLLDRYNEYSNTNSSWLQHWWNTMGYLQVRDRSPINVSYFFQLQDDPTCFVGDGSVQIRRGASMLWHMADYRYRVCSGSMPAETLGRKKTPLCSTAFKYMFHACRIPRKEQDSYTIYDPSRHTHAIVSCQGHFFSVDFLDDDGNVVPVNVLEDRLQQCVEMANSQAPKLELGWLTAANRDEWADARQTLLDVGGVPMEEALEKLQAGAMLLCLDDEAPVSRSESAYLWLHGMNPVDGDKKPCNRWFDKSIQIIVTKNGKAGLLGEHTMMDGMPMVGFAEHVAKHSHEDAVKGSSTYNGGNPPGGVENIFPNAIDGVINSDTVHQMMEDAKQQFTEFVQAHTIDVQSFQGYGSDFIKSAGFSPDAYVQMAMQLATYRLWGKQGGTYEATQTRSFLHGRTETTRTVSPASAAFCEAMGAAPQYNEHVESLRKEKLELLRDAVTSHVKYMGKAAAGEGVDRHLMGLSLCVGEGESMPALYSDPVFARSKKWRVSTSNLTHPLFVNWGYGEVVPNGLGLSYSVHKRFCMFNVTSLKEHGWSTKACQLLEEALLEMRALIEMDKPPTSKL